MARAPAKRTRTAATPKVIRKPEATTGRAAAGSAAPEATVNTAPMKAAPVISPRLRDRLSRPEMTPRRSGWAPSMTVALLAAWNSWYPGVRTRMAAR